MNTLQHCWKDSLDHLESESRRNHSLNTSVQPLILLDFMPYLLRTLIFLLAALFGYYLLFWWESASEWQGDRDLAPQNGQALLDQVDAVRRDSQLAQDTPTIRFENVTDTGLDFAYDNGATDEYHLAETLGGGIGASDFDGDGLTDLVFVNGGDPFLSNQQSANSLRFFRAVAPTKFMPRAEAAGCDWRGYGHGCSVGDFNNDGFDDFLITGYLSSAMYVNLGDGTFEDVTSSAGLTMDRWCATAAFGDLDLDGDLDLYVTAYADVPATRPTPFCEEGGQRIHCHPHHYPPVPDYLFENVGDGTFRDRSIHSGVAAELQYGLGVVIADFNNDLVPEIFVANDGDRNLLFQWAEDWRFSEIGTESGIAYSAEGQSMGSMGIACADLNRDGALDIVTTNFIHEPNLVFMNQGNGVFVDQSRTSTVSAKSRPLVGWSAVAFDANLDGLYDLCIANGHVTPSPSADFQQPMLLFSGTEAHGFEPLPNLLPGKWHGRTLLAGDFTSDGKPDLVFVSIHDQVQFLRNTSPSTGQGLALRLIGRTSNRSAAQVRLEFVDATSDLVMVRQLSGGYLTSSTMPILLIRQPESQEMLPSQPRIKLTWPSGTSQTLEWEDVVNSRVVIEP